MLQLEVHLGT